MTAHSYTQAEGIVLDIGFSSVKFNFGTGEAWLPKECIKERMFARYDIRTWTIKTWALQALVTKGLDLTHLRLPTNVNA